MVRHAGHDILKARGRDPHRGQRADAFVEDTLTPVLVRQALGAVAEYYQEAQLQMREKA